MHTDGAVHALHHALLNHQPCARADLLGGLEDKTHRARELLGMGVQELHRAEQVGHMRIVAAGVHDAGVLAREIQTGLLEDLKRVHVGAQQDHVVARGLGPLQLADDAGGLHAPVGDPGPVQLAADAVGGLELLEAGLRMAVQLAAEGDELFHAFMDLLSVSVHCEDSSCFCI